MSKGTHMATAEKVFVIGPTESILTQRGNRHPKLAAYLAGEGFRVEYVSSDFYHAEKRWFSRDEVAAAQGKVPYKLTIMKCLGYMKNMSARRVLSNLLLTMRFFFYLLPRVNRRTVVILPSRPVEIVFMGAALRLLRGTSVLMDIRDAWPDGFRRHVKSRLKCGLFSVYCHSFLYPSVRFIDKAVHTAPSFVHWLHRYAPRGRSVFVPLGFDADRWEDVPPDRTRTSQEPIRLVCVALLQRAIDVMPVLEAINGDDRFHLTLIGDDGKGERYPEVAAYIKRHKMGNVAMVGRVAPSHMGEHLARADVGVVPMNSKYVMPNKLFDYIGSYLPIMVLGENDSADLVEKMEIGWSCPYNAQGVKELLSKLNHQEIARKRVRLCEVRDTFDRENLFRIILAVLRSDEMEDVPADVIPVVPQGKAVPAAARS